MIIVLIKTEFVVTLTDKTLHALYIHFGIYIKLILFHKPKGVKNEKNTDIIFFIVSNCT